MAGEMPSDAEMLQVQDAGLARLAELQLALAEKLHRMAEAAEDAAEIATVAKGLEGISRSVRLTYALRVKLRKDVRSLDREEAAIQARERELASRRHWDAVRSRVETLTWHEIAWEEEDEDEFGEKLDQALDLESLDPDFCALSVEDQAARIIDRLGLPASVLPRRERRPEGSEGAAPAQGVCPPDFHSSA